MRFIISTTLVFILSATFLPFLLPAVASASGTVNINYTPLAPIPGTVTNDTTCTENTVGMTAAQIKAHNDACKVTNLGSYLRGIYMTGVALAGLFAVFSIVRGGFSLLFTDSILGKMEGKNIILRALGGLLVVFASFVLMDTINPALGRDLDLNLKFPQANIEKYVGTVVPVEIQYQTFLDDALAKTKQISTKAQDIKAEADDLERRLREGDYKDITEQGMMADEVARLRELEVEVRKYENTDQHLSTIRGQVNMCLVGQGACSVAVGKVDFSSWTFADGFKVVPGNIASTDRAENLRIAQEFVASARQKTNLDVAVLRANGLIDRANDLDQKMNNIENMTTFYVRCPDSKVTYVPGKGLETIACPK